MKYLFEAIIDCFSLSMLAIMCGCCLSATKAWENEGIAYCDPYIHKHTAKLRQRVCVGKCIKCICVSFIPHRIKRINERATAQDDCETIENPLWISHWNKKNKKKKTLKIVCLIFVKYSNPFLYIIRGFATMIPIPFHLKM